MNSPVVARCFYVYVHFTRLNRQTCWRCLFFGLFRHRPDGVGEVALASSSELVMKLGWGQ